MAIETEYVQFSKLVRQARVGRKMTQSELAAKAELSRATIASIESARQRISLLEAMKLSKVLRISLDNLTLFSVKNPLVESSVSSNESQLIRSRILKRLIQEAARRKQGDDN